MGDKTTFDFCFTFGLARCSRNIGRTSGSPTASQQEFGEQRAEDHGRKNYPTKTWLTVNMQILADPKVNNDFAREKGCWGDKIKDQLTKTIKLTKVNQMKKLITRTF